MYLSDYMRSAIEVGHNDLSPSFKDQAEMTSSHCYCVLTDNLHQNRLQFVFFLTTSEMFAQPTVNLKNRSCVFRDTSFVPGRI